MATYSSRGPDGDRRGGEAGAGGAGQPDRVGVGGQVVSDDARIRSGVVRGAGANAYIEMSGTSMSAAVVSGAAALLLEAQPGADAGGGQAAAAVDELAGGGCGADRGRCGESEHRGGGGGGDEREHADRHAIAGRAGRSISGMAYSTKSRNRAV